MSHLHTNCSMSRLHTNSYKSRVHTSVLARPKRQGAAPCCFFLRRRFPSAFQRYFGLELAEKRRNQSRAKSRGSQCQRFHVLRCYGHAFYEPIKSSLFDTHVLFTFCFSHFTRSPCLQNESYQRLINGASYPQRKHAPCNKER